MRSIWKGHIRFLLVAIPVRVYNAIETSEQIHLNQLHKDDYGPIGYDKRCKKCNKVVSKDDIIKGYQYAKDQYAILEPDDLAKVKLKTTKVIDIVGFVDKSEIPPMLYDSPYFVGPDGEVGAKTYALLREVLKTSDPIIQTVSGQGYSFNIAVTEHWNKSSVAEPPKVSPLANSYSQTVRT